MLSFEPELEQLRPQLGDARTNALVARDRREVFSLHPELRILSWSGAMLLATAAGLVLKNNLDRIGPLALAMAMGLAAAACYAFVWWRRSRPSIVHDYVILLGALLLSADVAFIETTFDILGNAWHRHFLILAIVHGLTAYLFRSRLVLSLSITATAAWLGVRGTMFSDPTDYATRAFACAALLLVWRQAHRMLERNPQLRDFTPTLEHFAANIAFFGSIALMFADDTRLYGCLAMLSLAALVVGWGARTKTESFVLYGVLYGVLGINVLLAHLIDFEAFMFLFVFVSVIGAIVSLIVIHARVTEWRS